MVQQRTEMTDDIFEAALQAASGQKMGGGFSLTKDPNFPVLPTMPEQQVIIYFPRTNVTEDENGKEKYGILPSIRHQVRNGQYKNQHRCIRDMQLEALGWDGECPICKASESSWALYNHLVEEEAIRMKLPSAQDDPTKILQPFKQKVGSEKDVDGREAFVTGAVVLIETDEKGMPTGEMKPYYIDFRLSRWNDKVIKAAQQVYGEDGQLDDPLGLFFIFDYNYDTKGKKAEARDAARNMTITAIQGARLTKLEELVAKAEESAQEFTLRQANKMLNALEFKPKAEVEEMANKAIRKTVQTLNVIEQQKQLGSGGVGVNPALSAPLVQPQAGQPALANFGQQVPEGTQPTLGAPVAGAPVAGMPIAGAPLATPPAQQASPQVQVQQVAPAPTAPVAPPAGSAPTAPPTAPVAPPVATPQQ